MQEQKLAGIKVLMVIAPEQFRDEELFTPKDILEGAGAKVVVASSQAGEAKGMLGGKATAALSIKEAIAEDYQAIVVVGGMGSPAHLWHNQDLKQIICSLAARGKLVAGICLSGAVLALAGVLKGKKATVWPDAKAIAVLKENGANYLSEHVVQDENIITADGPEAAEEFGRKLAESLAKVASKV